MKWFDSPIPEAIQFSKQKGVIFIVYIYGNDELSTQMNATWENDQISKAAEDSGAVVIRILNTSEECKFFSQIYPVVCVPATFFIGEAGVPLEVTGGPVSPEDFKKKLELVLKGIYQLFYKEASSMDRGSLYQLRNLINRRDVTGGPKDVISKFRPHHQFIEDVCDAYVVATFLDIMGMESEDSSPTSMPVFSLMNDKQKELWLNNAAEKVVRSLGLHFTSFDELRTDLEAYNADDVQVEAMKQNDSYLCAFCHKQYMSVVWFRKHLVKKHQWKFHDTEHEDLTPGNAIRTFLLMVLLYRDTCESFQTGDGDRLVRNAYFEWLYAASIKHTKYKIWLWRLITYVKNVLSPAQSFEYKWNMTVNLQGGIRSNIPNDNCVEIQVNNIKKLIERQGANKSFQAARQACMVTQVLDSIQVQLMKSTKTVKSGRSRPSVDKAKDIMSMVKCLRNQGQLKDIQWGSFSTFIDPLRCISASELHSWINGQRKIASLLMK